jgi:putative ABC transport system permease protein
VDQEGFEVVRDTLKAQEQLVTRHRGRPNRREQLGGPVPFHLALKEVWRNTGRFLLIALVVALITLLVLFIAGLAEGLGQGNREYIENLNAQLLVYQDKADLSIPTSRVSLATVRNVRQVNGVASAGAIAFTNVSLPLANGQAPLKVSLVGVQPGQPGEPAVIEGRGLHSKRADEAIIDAGVAQRTGLKVGDTLTIRSTVGNKEQLYSLRVAGISKSNQYFLQPSVFVPYITWDKLRPQASSVTASGDPDVTFNVVAVQLNRPSDAPAIAAAIEQAVKDVRAVDLRTAYENTPGYAAQQSTLNLMSVFTLLIGLLVIGGFFRIQTMQKVAQIGVLKAIGTSSAVIASSAMLQIFLVNAFGVLLGSLCTLALALLMPPSVPIRFVGSSILTTLVALLVIGPLGGLASIQVLLKAEPLRALGLAS